MFVPRRLIHRKVLEAVLALRRLRPALAIAVLAPALLAASAGSTTAAAAAPFCGITWGSLHKSREVSSQAALIKVRTGQHACFDRVVFDLDGPAHGYRATYADHVYSQGRGGEMDIVGGAKLNVGLLVPARQLEPGTLSFPYRVGAHVADVGGYRTLRDVVYGGAFEGYTTVGLGVRARLPFRVFTLAGPGGHSRIVIDVAHRWSN